MTASDKVAKALRDEKLRRKLADAIDANEQVAEGVAAMMLVDTILELVFEHPALHAVIAALLAKAEQAIQEQADNWRSQRDRADRAEAALSAAEQQIEKFKRMFELKSEATKRFEPCSGHIGKVNSQKDGCPWCRLERAEQQHQRDVERIAELERLLESARGRLGI